MNRKVLNVLIAVSLLFVMFSCIDDTYYGESKKAEIVAFDIEGQLDNKIEPGVDWNDTGKVYVVVPQNFDLAHLKVTNVKCSQLARFSTDPDTLTNFTHPVDLLVYAEAKGVQKTWVINVSQLAVEKEQLPFSNFLQWTPAKDQNGKPIELKGQIGYFPGNGSSNSPWQSTIEGNAISLSGLNDYSVYPNTREPQAQYARLTTLETKSGALMGTGVAAGGLFTGSFHMDASLIMGNEKYPRKMVNAGVPFYSKPKAVSFNMRYQPGPIMKNGKLQEIKPGQGLPTQDSCDVMFILQNRLANPNEWIRVATAMIRVARMGDINKEDGFEQVTLEFVYGEPTAAQIAEKPYQKIGGLNGELTFYKFTKSGDKWEVSKDPMPEVYASDPQAVEVDNIITMISSSTYGDLFCAAPGSILDIKDIEFIYE